MSRLLCALAFWWSFGVTLPPGGTGRIGGIFDEWRDCEAARVHYERAHAELAAARRTPQAWFTATTICRPFLGMTT